MVGLGWVGSGWVGLWVELWVGLGCGLLVALGWDTVRGKVWWDEMVPGDATPAAPPAAALPTALTAAETNGEASLPARVLPFENEMGWDGIG